MSIGFKFDLAMFPVSTLRFVEASFLTWKTLLKNAEGGAAMKVKIMIEAARSMRSYRLEEIRLLLRKNIFR